MTETAKPPRRFRSFLRWGLRLGPAFALVYVILGFLTSRLTPSPMVAAGSGYREAALGADPATGGDDDTAPGPTREGGDALGPTVTGEAAMAGAPEARELLGVLSVHTERSHDAEGSLDEVAAAARTSGLDFVVLGDHPGDWARGDDAGTEPMLRDGILVVGGLELVVREVGRVLVTGLDTVPQGRWDGRLDSLLARVDPAWGFMSVIHPRSPRARERWKLAGTGGVHAWEALDVSEMARTRLQNRWRGYHLMALLGSLVVGRGHESLLRLGREGFEWPGILAFDSLRATEGVTLTGGLNHHPKARILGRPFPAFEPFFRTVVNHVLVAPDAPPGAGPRWAAVAEALRDGRSFVSLGDADRARGFRFGAVGPANGRVGMGGVGPWDASSELRVDLPSGARGSLLVRLLKDGREALWVEAAPGDRLSLPAHRPGVYRVEVHRAGTRLGSWRWNRRPWLLSNPLELRSGAAPMRSADATPSADAHESGRR